MVITEITYKVISYGDIDNLIRKTYGHEFDIVADQEVCNGANLNFNVSKGTVESYDKQRLESFVEFGTGHFIGHLILTDLCNKDLLEEGNYLIKVSW